jgi:hypothetical protein
MNTLKQTLFIGLLLISARMLPAQTPTQLKAWLTAVPGWELPEEAEVFDPDNLFDRINGAAPLFLENNFREMTSLEYKKGDAYITIQAYRHATPEDAFGMYASERSDELTHFSIGGEAQGDAQHLYFFAGSIYVKMWSSGTEDAGQILQTIGTGLADKIEPAAAYPAIVKSFPGKGKLPCSETYITSGYIGHGFLKSVYAAGYEQDGQSFQLFVVDGKTKDGAKEVLTDYFTFTKQPLTFEEGALQIKDKYNGDIPARWKGRYLIGVYNENDEAVAGAEALLKELAGKLP